jgi:serine protease inhibitor
MWIRRNEARLATVIAALVWRLLIATSQVLAGPAYAPVPDADLPAGRTAFAWALLQEVAGRKPDTNFVLAPLSISATMALVHEGARGETAAEMARTLRLAGPDDDPVTTLEKLQTSAASPVQTFSLGAGLASNGGYGIRIAEVPSNSAAHRAGLKPGDLILALDGRPTRAKPRFIEALSRGAPNVKLQVFEYETGRVLDREVVLDRAAGPAAGDGSSMSVATSRGIWMQAGSTPDPQFQDIATRRYRAHLAQADFRGNRAGALESINTWLASKWSGTKPITLNDSDLEPDTRLFLLDHMSLRGLWAAPFPPPSFGRFRTDAGVVESTPLMRQIGRFSVERTERFDLLELPFARAELSFVVVLPRNNETLNTFIKKTSAAELATSLRQRKPRLVDVWLPSFHFQSSLRIEGVLVSMGMARTFSDQAEFPAINRKEPLRLSSVRHDVDIEVDERGTRAEAATAVAGVLIKGDETEPLAIHADRPFVFAIVVRDNGALLLLGVFTKPAQGAAR